MTPHFYKPLFRGRTANCPCPLQNPLPHVGTLIWRRGRGEEEDGGGREIFAFSAPSPLDFLPFLFSASRLCSSLSLTPVCSLVTRNQRYLNGDINSRMKRTKASHCRDTPGSALLSGLRRRASFLGVQRRAYAQIWRLGGWHFCDKLATFRCCCCWSLPVWPGGHKPFPNPPTSPPPPSLALSLSLLCIHVSPGHGHSINSEPCGRGALSSQLWSTLRWSGAAAAKAGLKPRVAAAWVQDDQRDTSDSQQAPVTKYINTNPLKK